MPRVRQVVGILRQEPHSVNPTKWSHRRGRRGGVLAGEVKDAVARRDAAVAGHRNAGGVMTTLIPRNTTIPSKKADFLDGDRQPVEWKCTLQANGARAVTARWDASIGGSPPAQRGLPQIEVVRHRCQRHRQRRRADKATGRKKITISGSRPQQGRSRSW